MTDVPHLLKNIRNCLENQTMILPQDIVLNNNLPCRKVSIMNIKTIVNMQEKMELKLVPGLSYKNIHSGQYGKMRVNNIFGHRVTLVMHNLADDGTMDDNAHTTAWFCDTTNSWFDIMSNRQYKKSLSKVTFAKDEYVVKLKEYLDFISKIEIKGKRLSKSWKPW